MADTKNAPEVKEAILVIVEGKDEKIFFESLIRYHKLNNFQIVAASGGADIGNVARDYFKANGSDRIRVLLIVRDAEDNPRGAADSSKAVLASVGIAAPENAAQLSNQGRIKGGYFVAPSADENGCLEDICIRSWERDSLLSCAESYLKCVAEVATSENRGLSLLTNEAHKSKAKLQTYLAAVHPDNVSLGVASQKGSIDLDHAAIMPVVDFFRRAEACL